jgi:hypothetical protein
MYGQGREAQADDQPICSKIDYQEDPASASYSELDASRNPTVLLSSLISEGHIRVLLQSGVQKVGITKLSSITTLYANLWIYWLLF